MDCELFLSAEVFLLSTRFECSRALKLGHPPALYGGISRQLGCSSPRTCGALSVGTYFEAPHAASRRGVVVSVLMRREKWHKPRRLLLLVKGRRLDGTSQRASSSSSSLSSSRGHFQARLPCRACSVGGSSLSLSSSREHFRRRLVVIGSQRAVEGDPK